MIQEKLFCFLQYILPKHLLSRITGKLAESQIEWLKNGLINRFINHFNVDMADAEFDRAEDYINFNAFFTRALKSGARPIDPDPKAIVSPCDGAISQLGKIDHQKILQAKGIHYTLAKLVAHDDDLVNTFVDGDFATCYLSPKDYHRVHMPFAGTLKKTIYVPGELFSVNNTTAKHVPDLFARNERLICHFDTEIGEMLVILVGAVIVAGIETVWSGQVTPSDCCPDYHHYQQQAPIHLNKGDELGRFKLGSTAILVFEKDRVNFMDAMMPTKELMMGEQIAAIK